MSAEIGGMIERLEGGAHCVTIYDRAFVLDQDFGRWLEATGADVVIDVARVNAVDQQLLSTLLRLRRRVAPDGARIGLVCREADRRILEMARFGRAFRLSVSRAEALRSLEASSTTAKTG